MGRQPFSVRAVRRQVVTYFVLAYALSWGAILVYLGALGFDSGAVGTEQLMVMLVLMLVGPPLAGLLLTGLVAGRRGFADLLGGITRVRVPLRWYALALAPVPILLLAILLPLAGRVSPDYAPTFLAFGVAAGLMAGAFEEIGWTGFATPRLLARYSPVVAGLILGLVWALWHGLADFVGNVAAMSVADWLIRMVLFWIVPLTAYRVVMTWAYAHHRSLALAVLMHAGYTGWLAALTMEMPAAAGPGALVWQAPFAVAIVLLTLTVVAWPRIASLRSRTTAVHAPARSGPG